MDSTVKSRLPHGGDSGDFWMSKDDWVKQFESMTICLMPDFFTNYHQREVIHHMLNIRVHSDPLSQVTQILGKSVIGTPNLGWIVVEL